MSTTFSENNVPYTYLLKWSHTGAWYYGVRFAKNCHPSDLWNTYFTSSKRVKEYVKTHGSPDIIETRRTFSSAKAARNWEYIVLRRIKAVRRNDCLNQTDNKAISPLVCALHTKGRTYEEIYGLEKALELKAKRSDSNRKRTGIKYKSMNRSFSNNDMKVCCVGCGKETSVSAMGRHKKKCFH